MDFNLVLFLWGYNIIIPNGIYVEHHFHQGYFNGVWVIAWLPQPQEKM